jgi:alpha-tubulin suppressor-like RCC1 family protein
VLITRRRAALSCIGLPAVLLALAAAPVAGATVAGGDFHTLVLRTTDNTVWAWGLNYDGQLGDNTTAQRMTPIQVTTLSGVVAVAAGAKHSLALTSAGVLYAWGDNQYGQIGNGNNTDQKLPVQVMTGVALVAAGDYHTIALKSDGTFYTWGRNNEGQLADGGTTDRNSPYQVTGLGLVSAIAGGGSHTLVVLVGGSMKSWGKNSNGQLGDGSTYARATSPVAVSTVTTATSAAGGSAFSFARNAAGTLHAWGYNSNGQLGFGDTTQRPTPTQLTTPTSVAAVATGDYHTIALLDDGSVMAWGNNSYGSVGDGTGVQRTSPVVVPGLSSVVAVGAGQYHSVAVTSAGEVWTWGYNNTAQLGDGTTATRLSPVKVAEAGFSWKAATPTFSPVPNTYTTNQNVTISCATSGATIRYTTDGTEPSGSSSLYSSPVGITTSTTLKAKAFEDGLADSNVASGLYTLKVATPNASPGAGTYTSPQTVTLTVGTSGATIRYTTDGTDPTEVSTAYTAPLAIGTTTTLKAAGFKAGWAMSDIRTATYTMNFGTLAAPTLAPAPANYVDSVSVTITAAEGATIRYTTNGSTPTPSSTLYTGPVGLTQTTTLKAKAWKVDYTESPVATGTYTLKVAPPLLSLVSGTYAAGTTVTVTAATAGASLRYTLDGSDPTENDTAIASGGSLVLGNYTLEVRSFKGGCDPSDVVSATYTVSGELTSGMVSAGKGFSLAVLPDGTAWSWGSNANGKLGTGSTAGALAVPGPIEALTGVVAIAAADDHALALAADGVVWSWGKNSSGQLGIGTTSSYESTPRLVSSLSGVVAIAAGGDFSAAIKSDGTLWVWGENGSSQLGLGDTTDRSTPTQVLAGVAQVALGRTHAVAFKSDGSVWAWGANGNGQLGDGTTNPRNVPGQVSGLAGATHVAAGATWSFVIAGGTAYAFGQNWFGQLGDGSTTDRRSPTAIAALAGVLGLEAGDAHSLARAADGSALSWGLNGYGQLGDGTTTSRSTPTTVPGLAAVASISAGEHQSLAMTSDGSIWAWGLNYDGRLGDGTGVRRLSPVKIRDGSLWKAGTPLLSPAGGSYTGVTTVTLTSATPGTTIHYTRDGSDPSPADPSVPSGGTITVSASQTVKARATAQGKSDSNVAAETFTLTVANPAISPPGSTFNSPLTVTITCSVEGATIRYTTNGVDPTLSDPVIASGGTIPIDFTQTLKVKAWKAGWNDSAVVSRTFTMVVATPTLSPGGGTYAPGQLVTVATATPDAELHYTTNGLDPTVSDPLIASGGSVTVDHGLTVKAKGWRTGWTGSATVAATYFVVEGTVAAPSFDPAPGSFAAAQTVTITTSTTDALVRYTIDGTTPGTASTLYTGPVAVAATRTLSARAFKVGWSASAATVGTYTIASEAAATPVIAPPGGVFAAGRRATISSPESGVTIRYTTTGVDPTETDAVIASGGTVILGRSLRLKARAWKPGLDPSPVAVADFDLVGAVSAGGGHNVVLKSDGTLVAWGSNYSSQLGDGTTADRARPTPVQGLTDVVAVSAGYLHNLALRADSTVWAWGHNANGELGDGTGTNRSVPVQVTDATTAQLTGVVSISAGTNHSLALKADGSVWAWGYGNWGANGDGTESQRNRAIQVPGLSGITAISARGEHCVAVKTDGGASGTLWVWGRNLNGELADGSTTNRLVPIKVADQVDYVTTGANQTFVRTAGGLILGAGLNDQGQLGDGTVDGPRLALSPALLDVAGVELISSSGVHTLALSADGTLTATGDNDEGEVGDGSRLPRSTPASVANLTDVIDAGAGRIGTPVGTYYAHSVALTADGRAWTWGSSANGMLGNGVTSINQSRFVPKPVEDFSACDRTWLDGDPDGDGLLTAEELRAGTDPLNADTNGDGITDLVAVRSGISATNPDMDSDGVANAAEIAQGTDPFRADTDGDGVLDGADCYPLDAARSTCPEPIPGDVTPPVITLTEPTGAVLVSSVP